MLTLPIQKKWFDMIDMGIKKEEYRNVNKHYISRFARYRNSGEAFGLRLRNGYSSTSPMIECIAKVELGIGKEEWGAEPLLPYFVIKIMSHRRIL